MLVIRAGKRQLRIVITGAAVVALAAAVAAAPAISAGGPAPAPAVSNPEGAAPAATPPVATPLVSQAQQEPGQQGTPPPPAGEQQEPTAPAPGTLPGTPELLTPEERQALALVEQLIRDQEGVLMGTGFDYVEEGRRDPFRSLVVSVATNVPTERPFGLPGFLIGEVELTAIAELQGRWHAMVTAPDQRSYFLEVGTELFDGHVVSIGAAEVIFEQIVPDLTGARRTRQVTKRLRTTDGGWETP